MDEQEGLRQAGLAMSSDKEISVRLPIPELWLIVSGLQLTVTHPNLHEPLKTMSEQIGRKLGALILEQLPDVAELLEAGWDRQQDSIIYEDYGEYQDDDWDDGEYDDMDSEEDLPW
jgi:hypothetical protein